MDFVQAGEHACIGQYVLDALQVRTSVPPEARGQFAIGTIRAALYPVDASR